MLVRSALFRADFLSQPSDDSSLGGATANIQMTRPPARPGLTLSKLPMLHTVITVEDQTLPLDGRPEQVSQPHHVEEFRIVRISLVNLPHSVRH